MQASVRFVHGLWNCGLNDACMYDRPDLSQNAVYCCIVYRQSSLREWLELFGGVISIA